jgi:hypothetical protein
MNVGDNYWWCKEAGVKYRVEIVSLHFTTPPSHLLPAEAAGDCTVLVRVLAGVHKGMYAIVDESRLTPFDET